MLLHAVVAVNFAEKKKLLLQPVARLIWTRLYTENSLALQHKSEQTVDGRWRNNTCHHLYKALIMQRPISCFLQVFAVVSFLSCWSSSPLKLCYVYITTCYVIVICCWNISFLIPILIPRKRTICSANENWCSLVLLKVKFGVTLYLYLSIALRRGSRFDQKHQLLKIADPGDGGTVASEGNSRGNFALTTCL